MTKPFDVPLYPYLRHADQDAEAPARHSVVIVGAGPVGLSLAIDLAMRDIDVVVLDDNDRVSRGSRAICFAKRTLEIFDRLGLGDALVEKGVQWNLGKVYAGERQVFAFNLQPEAGHRRPAFINLQQYHLEVQLVRRLQALGEAGRPVSLRGRNRVTHVAQGAGGVDLDIATPDGTYRLVADYLVACDGATSPVRTLLGLDFVGRVFEDNFLIADVVMPEGGFPTERRFWFDPPFNRGQSALLHKQPDNVWRIDLQLGRDIDREREARPENVIPRIRAFLGEAADFTLDWISIYTFQCRRMERFVHGRVLFAGDSAHQVSPFGARGANSGVQDADNLGWKLALVASGRAPATLLETYNVERVAAADENIGHSTRATDFITPRSETSRLFRDAVLDLAVEAPFARALVNSGRLSMPSVHEASPLNGADDDRLPARTRPGSPAADAPFGLGWLMDAIGGHGFTLLALNVDVPAKDLDSIPDAGDVLSVVAISLEDDTEGLIRARYLGEADGAVYLLRPDQHVVARWSAFDLRAIREALDRAFGRGTNGEARG